MVRPSRANKAEPEFAGLESVARKAKGKAKAPKKVATPVAAPPTMVCAFLETRLAA